jgi:hypothetical protein
MTVQLGYTSTLPLAIRRLLKVYMALPVLTFKAAWKLPALVLLVETIFTLLRTGVTIIAWGNKPPVAGLALKVTR